MTPSQLRAARAMLGWSPEQLAEWASVTVDVVLDCETGKLVPCPICTTLRDAVERAGIMIIPAADGLGEGVRFAPVSYEPKYGICSRCGEIMTEDGCINCGSYRNGGVHPTEPPPPIRPPSHPNQNGGGIGVISGGCPKKGGGAEASLDYQADCKKPSIPLYSDQAFRKIDKS
jgi:hypothetical protein